MKLNNLSKLISKTLENDTRVVFAYLYGSAATEAHSNDIDIAVYSIEHINPHQLSADLKIALHKSTQLPPDFFDLRVVNDLLKTGDIFTILFLKNVLSANRVLVDRNTDIRTDYIEAYGLKYRECEGIMQELIG